jgi:hypothetical protein
MAGAESNPALSIGRITGFSFQFSVFRSGVWKLRLGLMLSALDSQEALNRKEEEPSHMTIIAIGEASGDTGLNVAPEGRSRRAEQLRGLGTGLTQSEIDARAEGWEYGSKSTNALMARVLAELGRVSNQQ